MSRYAQVKIFSMLFGVVYTICFYYNWALFRYYPVLGQWYRASQPPAEAGPAILWYGWLAEAFVISLVISLAVPRKLAARISADAAWIVPAALILAIIVYERRWFY